MLIRTLSVTDWKRRDNPITRLRKFMELRSWWDQDADTALRSQLRKDILKAFNNAEKAKKPAISKLWEDIYDEPSADQKQQMKELREILEEYKDEYDVEGYEGGRSGVGEQR
jgi:2-oxoisovalerate dehydrogenase E1 component alpha subunit